MSNKPKHTQKKTIKRCIKGVIQTLGNADIYIPPEIFINDTSKNNNDNEDLSNLFDFTDIISNTFNMAIGESNLDETVIGYNKNDGCMSNYTCNHIASTFDGMINYVSYVCCVFVFMRV